MPRNRYEMGGGGLVSTLADYAQFALMLLNKGELNGVRVLSSNTVEWMASNHLPDNADIPSMSALPRADFGIGFGLGFGVQLGGPSRHNRRGKGTFYWGGAASTLFWVDPSNDLIAVFLTQMMGQNPARPIHPPLITLVYGALADAPAARL
jgi:CubicO group peptidase (beta-lactamase class C family)